MILTGPEIIKEVKSGNVFIEPFLPDQVNPNSYNYRLGDSIKIYCGFDGKKSIFKEVEIPSQDGLVLFPGKMYLANTYEVIGSKKYAMSLIGRSSIGRFGLFLQQSANLGHTTACHRWTLEMYACLPFRVYPRMKIGQVSFWTNQGKINNYSGKYGHCSAIKESQTTW
jgi:dCTP deaminase